MDASSWKQKKFFLNRKGVKMFDLSETLLQSNLKENEDVAESWNVSRTKMEEGEPLCV
jgi:hypothetical protein